MSSSPAAASSPASASRAGEALDRARQVRVGGLVARQPPERRHERGRTRARRRSTAAASAASVISSTTTRPPGRTTRAISAEPARQVGEVARAEADRRGVERVVLVRQRQRVGPLEPHRRLLAREPARASPRRSRSPTTSAPAAAQRDREVARAGRDVERARSRRDARQLDRALAPALVHADGHDRVHEVVDAGDAVEHRADLRCLGSVPRYFSDARKSTSSWNFSGWFSRSDCVRRHRRRRVHERALDRRRRQARADLGQVRARARGCRSRRTCGSRAARRGGHVTALLVLRLDVELDLGRRAGGRAEDREVGHRADRGDAGERRDRPLAPGCAPGRGRRTAAASSRTRQIVGMPIVARNTSSGGLTTRSSSNRKKKYHSGRGT